MNPKPRVTLLSWTMYPLETVYSVWEASKGEDKLRTPEEIRKTVSPEEIEELFRAVIAQRIPVGEHVDLVFMLENVSVSWREQAVRHRIGTNPSPERLGSDIVMLDKMPDLADSSWWSQSMRIQNMGKFADNGAYRLPETLAGKRTSGTGPGYIDEDAEAVFHRVMNHIQDAYNALVAAGVPMEDARELIPLGAQHRISWRLNIGSLQHIVGKRGCWILQLGIWGPIITGMIEECALKIHPIFRELVTPPCLHGDDFKGCIYMEECRRRITGDDALPPCPLHLNYHHIHEDQRGMLPLALQDVDVPMKDEMMLRAESYRHFWGRNPYTGHRSGK